MHLEARVAELERQKLELASQMETMKRLYELKLQEARAKIKDQIRRMYGPSSEKIDPEQHLLAFASGEADQKIADVVQPEPAPFQEAPKPRAKHGARRPIPENLPFERVEHDLPEDQKRDPQTGEPLVQIARRSPRESITVPAALSVSSMWCPSSPRRPSPALRFRRSSTG